MQNLTATKSDGSGNLHPGVLSLTHRRQRLEYTTDRSGGARNLERPGKLALFRRGDRTEFVLASNQRKVSSACEKTPVEGPRSPGSEFAGIAARFGYLLAPGCRSIEG